MLGPAVVFARSGAESRPAFPPMVPSRPSSSAVAASIGATDVSLAQQLFCLKRENADLRNYAERVTKELRGARLAQAVASAAVSAKGDDSPRQLAQLLQDGSLENLEKAAEKIALPPWCLNMQFVSPLLAAYDERIAELESAASRSENDLRVLTERVAAVTGENERLAAELRSKTERLQQVFKAESEEAGGKSISALLQERAELEDLYALTSEQNEVLLSQNHLLKCHVQQTEQAIEEMRCLVADTERRAAALSTREETCSRNETRLVQLETLLMETSNERDEISRKERSSQREVERLSQALNEASQRCEALTLERRTLEEAAASASALKAQSEQLQKSCSSAEAEAMKAQEVADFLEAKLARETQEAEQLRKQLAATTEALHVATVEKERHFTKAQLLQQHLEQTRASHDAELRLLRSAQGEALETRASQAESQLERLKQQLAEEAKQLADLTVKLEAAERRERTAKLDAETAREDLASSSKHHAALQQHLKEAQEATLRELEKTKEELNAQIEAERSKAQTLLLAKQKAEEALAGAEASRAAITQEHLHLQAMLDKQRSECSEHLKQLAFTQTRAAAAEAEVETVRKRTEREVAEVRRSCEELAALAEAKSRRLEEAMTHQQAVAAQKLEEEQRLCRSLTDGFRQEKERLQQRLSKAVSVNAILQSKVNELLSGLDHTPPSRDAIFSERGNPRSGEASP